MKASDVRLLNRKHDLILPLCFLLHYFFSKGNKQAFSVPSAVQLQEAILADTELLESLISLVGWLNCRRTSVTVQMAFPGLLDFILFNVFWIELSLDR